MNGKDLSRHLSELPEEMIAEAMAPAKPLRHRNIAWRALRLAACFAVVIGLLTVALGGLPGEDQQYVAIPGGLKVYACEIEGKDEFELRDYALVQGFDNHAVLAWSPHLNAACYGIPLSVFVNETDLQEHTISVEFTTNYGDFVSHGYLETPSQDSYISEEQAYGKHAILWHGDTIFWDGTELWRMMTPDNTMEDVMAQVGRVFVDIIVRADGNIIAYAVVEMVCTMPDLCLFIPKMIESSYYPKVEEEFQPVTEKYIAKQIEKAKSA